MLAAGGMFGLVACYPYLNYRSRRCRRTYCPRARLRRWPLPPEQCPSPEAISHITIRRPDLHQPAMRYLPRLP